MKLSIDIPSAHTPEQADEVLEKALRRKKECSNGERYCDPAVNEFHDYVAEKHQEMVKQILSEIDAEIQRDVLSRGY